MAVAGRLIRQNRPATSDFELDLTDDGFPDLTSTSSGSGSAGSLLNAQVNRDKFLAEQAAARSAAARTQAGTQASTDYIRRLLSGSSQPFGNLESEIAGQETAGRTYIEDQAKALSDLIAGRRTQARDVTTSGYDALRNFLTANPMQAYAQTQAAVPTVQNNVLEQYMASRGIGSQPAQAGQDVANAQLAAQAGNYNQLLSVLQGAEAQQQSSRLAEEQMARALAGTQLEALYGSQTAGLEQQRLAALNELLGRSSAARVNAEQLRIAREQQLQDAIAKLLGTGVVAPIGTETFVPPVEETVVEETVVPPPATRAQRVETAAQEFASFKEAIKALNPKQVAALTNDGTGLSAKEIAELKRKNPKLAAQFR